MNQNIRIIELIQNPETIKFSDKIYIEQELEKYPFVQTFHMLMLKWNLIFASKEEVEKYTEKISIYSTYRELIKKFIEKNTKQKNIPKISSEESNKKDKLSEKPIVFKQENMESKSYINQLGISYLFSENKADQLIDVENDVKLMEVEIQGFNKEEELKEDRKDITIEEITDKELVNKSRNQITQLGEEISTSVEKLTFNQWLSLPEKPSINLKKLIEPQEKQKNIIDKFIESSPKISTPKKTEKSIQKIDFKKDEIKEIANLMTTTLAQLYVEQGKYDTAITAFKILSLKYPEKSSYFASEIRKINKLKNSR